MESIGNIANTDKITHHGYHRFYPKYLDGMRDTADGILEIGIDKTKSVELWKNYFSKAHIYGIDIGLSVSDERVTIFKSDQSKLDHLIDIKSQIKHNILFIIDDGSHIPEHQLLTFDYFFNNLLEDGGVYIIEDIETSYWTKYDCYGYPTRYGYKHKQSLIEKVKPLIDYINFEFLNEESRQKLSTEINSYISDETCKNISTITFGQNCVIFTKKTDKERLYDNRQYRFHMML